MIPVLRPQLPSASRLLPYLERIDSHRTYTNWGPLNAEFESRLAEHFQLPQKGVVTASSGTSALVGAILATAGRAIPGASAAVIPAFTFVATALAVMQCGYDVRIADVDPTTWSLDPERLHREVDLDGVGLVVPVAPFGRPVPQEPWEAFRDQTGIPVVVDGAASLECVASDLGAYLGRLPVAFSFHATKAFSCGEGGAVATDDLDLAVRTTRALNFGFWESRDTSVASTNGKLSEYHAAVGLAELDGWREKKAALDRVIGTYRRLFDGAGLGERLVAAPQVCSAYVIFRCESASESERVRRSLESSGVGYRLWYGRGVHHLTYFREAPREHCEVTDELAPRLIGLPIACDLPEATIAEVVGVVAEGATL